MAAHTKTQVFKIFSILDPVIKKHHCRVPETQFPYEHKQNDQNK